MARLSSDPWDEFRERMRKDPMFGPFFAEIDREFDRIQETFQRMLEDAEAHAKDAQTGDPYVYGFTFRLGPDGKPQFSDFGNARPRVDANPEEAGAREPLVDTLVHDETLTITAELPGVAKKDIKLRAAEDAITIRVNTDARRYYKRIDLPKKVKPDTTKATYKNGVLDIEVDRAEPGEDEGTDVVVE